MCQDLKKFSVNKNDTERRNENEKLERKIWEAQEGKPNYRDWV